MSDRANSRIRVKSNCSLGTKKDLGSWSKELTIPFFLKRQTSFLFRNGETSDLFILEGVQTRVYGDGGLWETLPTFHLCMPDLTLTSLWILPLSLPFILYEYYDLHSSSHFFLLMKKCVVILLMLIIFQRKLEHVNFCWSVSSSQWGWNYPCCESRNNIHLTK